jgi:hypothetical protein
METENPRAGCFLKVFIVKELQDQIKDVTPWVRHHDNSPCVFQNNNQINQISISQNSNETT